MNDLERKIKINDNRILIYTITPGYSKPTYTIMEGFIEDDNIIKTYSLSQWDDYGFNGWSNNDENTDKLSFIFDISHPLYVPLFHLLNYDNELLIDDDSTKENKKNYILIHRKEDKIYLDFIDKREYRPHLTERLQVFVKNIVADGRSKIDQDYKDTKKRLMVFFNEVYKEIIDEYHQISIEEYLLKNKENYEDKQMAKVFKRKLMSNTSNK